MDCGPSKRHEKLSKSETAFSRLTKFGLLVVIGGKFDQTNINNSRDICEKLLEVTCEIQNVKHAYMELYLLFIRCS